MIITVPAFSGDFIKIGFLAVKWYSLAYIFGLWLGWLLIKKINFSLQKLLFQDKEFCDDFFFYMVLGVVIGGRLGYVIFYNPLYYLSNFGEIFAVWNGGMSFHGGLAGALVAIKLLCRKYSIDMVRLSDLVAVATPIGLFLGRIANFINLELYGRKTGGSFGFIFPNTDGLPRHPTQLYEAFLEGIVLFTILALTTKKDKLKTKGLNSSLFLSFYGLFRVFVECFREPDEQIGLIFNLFTMGQILSLPIMLMGFWWYCKIAKTIIINKRKK